MLPLGDAPSVQAAGVRLLAEGEVVANEGDRSWLVEMGAIPVDDLPGGDKFRQDWKHAAAATDVVDAGSGVDAAGADFQQLTG